MKQSLRSVEFYKNINEIFTIEKKRTLSWLFEDLNRPVPDVRFFQAEFRRLSQFESNLYKILEQYPDHPPELYNKENIYKMIHILTGLNDF